MNRRGAAGQVLHTDLSRSVSALRESIRDEGLLATVWRMATVAAAQLAFPITRKRREKERFVFRGRRLPYTFSRYNNSFLNERVAEISIAKWFLSGAGGRVLEIGNVLSHYGFTGHTVLDKYEDSPGILNDDIVDFVPRESFATVVAISTLEHVGRDEDRHDPDKVFRAIDAVRNCVAPGGRLLVTVPIGYNKVLDAALRAGTVKFPQESWLVRTSRRNDWSETDRNEALGRKYGRPYSAANALYIAMING